LLVYTDTFINLAAPLIGPKRVANRGLYLFRGRVDIQNLTVRAVVKSFEPEYFRLYFWKKKMLQSLAADSY